MKHRHVVPDSAMLGWSVDWHQGTSCPGVELKREE
jgi:hypothetical protein